MKQELTLSDKSELTKKFHDHVGGGAKAKAVKDFFDDISIHPNDVLKKAKKVFKSAEQVDEKYLRLKMTCPTGRTNLFLILIRR